MKEIIINVEGMKCGMCEAHVNDAVRKAAYVKSVKSSHKGNLTKILCEDDIDVELITSAIKALGYNVLGFESHPYEKKGLFHRFKK